MLLGAIARSQTWVDVGNIYIGLMAGQLGRASSVILRGYLSIVVA
jgi:hypothetical protein